jgi:hypothetical protein
MVRHGILKVASMLPNDQGNLPAIDGGLPINTPTL